MVIEASNGREFYLVEVIAFILKYLRNMSEGYISQSGCKLIASNLDWVITIPTIWSSSLRGKLVMREAAYMVMFIVVMTEQILLFFL